VTSLSRHDGLPGSCYTGSYDDVIIGDIGDTGTRTDTRFRLEGPTGCNSANSERRLALTPAIGGRVLILRALPSVHEWLAK